MDAQLDKGRFLIRQQDAKKYFLKEVIISLAPDSSCMLKKGYIIIPGDTPLFPFPTYEIVQVGGTEPNLPVLPSWAYFDRWAWSSRGSICHWPDSG